PLQSGRVPLENWFLLENFQKRFHDVGYEGISMYFPTIRQNRRAFLTFLAASPLLAAAGFDSRWLDYVMAEQPPQSAAEETQQNQVIIKSIKEALNVFDFDAAARTKLSTAHYTFITDGSFNNETLRANREGFSKYQLRLRRLNGIQKVDQSIQLFGQT